MNRKIAKDIDEYVGHCRKDVQRLLTQMRTTNSLRLLRGTAIRNTAMNTCTSSYDENRVQFTVGRDIQLAHGSGVNR